MTATTSRCSCRNFYTHCIARPRHDCEIKKQCAKNVSYERFPWYHTSISLHVGPEVPTRSPSLFAVVMSRSGAPSRTFSPGDSYNEVQDL